MRFRFQSGAVVAVLLALIAGSVSVATAPKLKRLPNDERTITHVLNRIGFGPAPGDVERVSQMGVEHYIDQQLHPEKLPDVGMANRLAGFDTLHMSSGQIASRYYMPLQQARREVKREQGQNQQAQPQPQRDPAMKDDAKADAPGEKADAAAPKTLPNGALDLSDLPPEERARIVELRRGQQQVMDELMQQKLLRAIYSDHQLEEQLVDFWFNHFNVFVGKGPERVYLTEYERDVIRPHVFGKFRDLLGATAHSPAMLFYLDNWQSSDPNADLRRAREQQERQERQQQRAFARRRFFAPPMPPMPPQQAQQAQGQQQQLQLPPKRKPGLNENYARELMELHTLGVNGGYTQQDVIEVAKCFTGWTIDRPQQGGDYRFDDRRHVQGAKTVLGKKIDAGGERDGEKVLDMLAAHPSTAKFIATKLVRKFVSDEPPPALIDRVAKTFHDTQGDLREVVRTIITSPEFFDPSMTRAKVKTPFEFVASALRATGAQVEDARVLVQNLRQMGMPLYGAQPPTGYVDHAETWVNTGALLNRINFANALANNKLRGITIETEPTQVAALGLASPEFQRR
jgi:uncharacterized protein (DUF1800 family)